MKIALITGASSGMGREFALQIGRAYASLDEIWVIARRRSALEELEKEFCREIKGCSLRLLSLDLTSGPDMEALKKELARRKPCIRLLVNGAGVGHYGPAAELTVEEQLQMVDVNCRALTQVTLSCLPYLTGGSRILQLASGSAFLPQKNFAVYAAGKAYVVSFSRALQKELKKRRITVTSVCPGPVDTEFFAHGGITLPVWKRPFLVKPEKVVRKALFDAQAGRSLSICGMAMKVVRFWGRLLF